MAATVLGALGAHVLHASLTAQKLLAYDTAVRYQFYHALGLLMIGVLMRKVHSRLLDLSALAITAGVVLFSGSLYALAFGAPALLGSITPLGGLFLILGWLIFVLSILRERGSGPEQND